MFPWWPELRTVCAYVVVCEKSLWGSKKHPLLGSLTSPHHPFKIWKCPPKVKSLAWQCCWKACNQSILCSKPHRNEVHVTAVFKASSSHWKLSVPLILPYFIFMHLTYNTLCLFIIFCLLLPEYMLQEGRGFCLPCSWIPLHYLEKNLACGRHPANLCWMSWRSRNWGCRSWDGAFVIF